MVRDWFSSFVFFMSPRLHAAKDLWGRGGYTAATRGMGISVVGSSLHNGLVFMGYYSMRSWWWQDTEGKILPFFVCGVAAGAFAQLTYPLELLRKTALYEGLHAFDATRKIVLKEGILGLYKGSVANLFKVAPLFGLQFACYEIMLRVMTYNTRNDM